jgi:hypothetical protein
MRWPEHSDGLPALGRRRLVAKNSRPLPSVYICRGEPWDPQASPALNRRFQPARGSCLMAIKALAITNPLQQSASSAAEALRRSHRRQKCCCLDARLPFGGYWPFRGCSRGMSAADVLVEGG